MSQTCNPRLHFHDHDPRYPWSHDPQHSPIGLVTIPLLDPLMRHHHPDIPYLMITDCLSLTHPVICYMPFLHHCLMAWFSLSSWHVITFLSDTTPVGGLTPALNPVGTYILHPVTQELQLDLLYPHWHLYISYLYLH